MSNPTQSEIARHTGVSRSTVALALNPRLRHKVNAETREQVEAAAAALAYRPNRYAQIMRNGRSGILGVLRFPGFSQLRQERELHLTRQIRDCSYQPFVVGSATSMDDVARLCDELLDARPEGIVLDSPGGSMLTAALELLRPSGVPLVTLMGMDIPGLYQVRADMRVAQADLTRHLIRLGRRRIALLISWNDPRTRSGDWWRIRDRIAGFADALREAGGSLQFDPEYQPFISEFEIELAPFTGPADIVGYVHPEPLNPPHLAPPTEPNWFDVYLGGQWAIEHYLQHARETDAIHCTNDDWAIAAISTCSRAGFRIPDDIAITGFDDTAVAPYLNPPLTTAAQPTAQMARVAVEMLQQLMSNQPPKENLVRLPASIVIRNSCGAP